jgi:hypothetical protein
MALSDYHFCFFWLEDYRMSCFVLVEHGYWEEQHHIEDRHLCYRDPELRDFLVTLGLAECMESHFDLSCTKFDQAPKGRPAYKMRQMIPKMRAVGMTSRPDLDDFINNHGGRVYEVKVHD